MRNKGSSNNLIPKVMKKNSAFSRLMSINEVALENDDLLDFDLNAKAIPEISIDERDDSVSEAISEKSSTRGMKIKIEKKPKKLIMIKPVNQENEGHNMAYTVHAMTPLERSKNMLQLETQQKGMIDITDNYFDFHESFNKPNMKDNQVLLQKAMSDKLMEFKFYDKFINLPDEIVKLNNI